MSFTNRMFDCIKSNNLTMEELDRITHDIHNTLTDSKGNKLFEKFLFQFKFSDSLVNFNLYNTCSQILNEEQNRSVQENLSEESLNSLLTQAKIVKELIETNDTNAIDFYIMKSFNEALKTKNKEELLDVLERIKEKCQNSLQGLHENFRCHILE